MARYKRSFFLGMLREAGLEVSEFRHATELDGQTAVVARPSPGVRRTDDPAGGARMGS